MNDNIKLHDDILMEIHDTYMKKNSDYGDSFSKSFEEFGLIAPVVRMNDKMNRIKSLSKKGGRQVKGESLRDSLMDLANYAMMTVIELDQQVEDWKKENFGTIERPDTFEQLQEKVLSWAKDKDLLYSQNADKQFMKFIEEVFEFKSEMDLYTTHVGKMKDLSKVHLKDEMGDVFVTLIILCEQLEIDPVVCLQMAYEKIRDRKGKTINGTFVKEEDL